MSFQRQIIAEVMKMLRYKFILVSGVVILLFVTATMPIIVKILDSKPAFIIAPESFGAEIERHIGSEKVEWNGIVYENNNFLSYIMAVHLAELEEVKTSLSGDAGIYSQEILYETLDFIALYVNSFEDDSDDLMFDVHSMSSEMAKKYIYGLQNPNYEALKEVREKTEYVISPSFELDEYIDMSDEQRQARYERSSKKIYDFMRYMQTDDLASYISYQRVSLQEQQERNEKSIETLQRKLTEGKISNEEYDEAVKTYIERTEQINTIFIPILDYREQHGILPSDGSWQDEALNLLSYSALNIDLVEIISEETFDIFKNNSEANQAPYTGPYDGYATYEEYLFTKNQELQKLEFDYFVARTSLETGNPDMAVATNGSRSHLYDSLNGHFIVVLFAILIGGYLMSAEYQDGTIRLLMIRPKTRIKILMSRYLAGLLLIYLLYIGIIIVSIVSNGFMYGFEDYLHPNHTPSGEIDFFIMLLGDCLAISTIFLFVYSVGFFCCILSKNTAISTTIPIFLVIGSTLLMQYTDANVTGHLLNFTPLTTLSLHELLLFEIDHAMALHDIKEARFIIISDFGAAVNVIYSVALVAASAVVFKKRDV